MRIAVLHTQVPFATGGAEAQADGLVAALREHGHQAEIVSLPFRWYPPELVLDHMLAGRLLNIEEANGVTIDLAIGLKFPAYLIPHPRKVLWVMHQFRQAYDLWDTPYDDMRACPLGARVREAVHAADRACFAEARAVFTTTRTVAERMKTFNDVTATPVYHPPPQAERFRIGDYGNYFYYPSRFNRSKRHDLVVRALAKCREPVRVVFSGSVENAAEVEALKRDAERLGVADRVAWEGRVGEEEKLSLYAGCRAVVFTPWDEDYGYVPLEAMLSGKAVVTCTDSGGAREFVVDGGTGKIVVPSPEAVAEALDLLWRDKALAARMGAAGRDHLRTAGLDWRNVVSRLLG